MRRENLRRSVQSRDDLLKVVASRFKARWRWNRFGQFVITQRFSWSAGYDNEVITLCYEWVAHEDSCYHFTWWLVPRSLFFTCCRVKADTLWWTDHSLNSRTEVSNLLNETEISTPSIKTVEGNWFRKKAIARAEVNIVPEEHRS